MKKEKGIVTMESLRRKKLEFQWNTIPRQDYLYFLDARIISHLNAFVQYLSSDTATKYGKGKIVNAWFPCLKSNGDLNSIFSVTRIQKGNVLKVCIDRDQLESKIFDLVQADVETGQIGQVVYNVEVKHHGLFLSRTALKAHVDNKKLVKRLFEYRNAKTRTVNNQHYFNHFYITKHESPSVVTNPRKNKRTELFWSDIDEVQ